MKNHNFVTVWKVTKGKIINVLESKYRVNTDCFILPMIIGEIL